MDKTEETKLWENPDEIIDAHCPDIPEHLRTDMVLAINLYAQQVSMEVAIKFTGYYKTKILQLSDSPATGDYLRSELFNEWKKQNNTILYPKTDEDAFKPRTNGLRPLDEHFPKNQEDKQ